MFIIIAVLAGYLAGILINYLADTMPVQRYPELKARSTAPERESWRDWLVLGRLAQGKSDTVRTRDWLTELSVPALFAVTGLVIPASPPFARPIVCLYLAILTLIIVIDMENKLILHAVTFPTTLTAILLSSLLHFPHNWLSGLLGAALGFIFFYILFLVGQYFFGPGALGFGDVTLSMTMGAMLGLNLILYALIMGILLGGLISLLLILVRLLTMRSRIPYGQFLAVSAMIMLLWGPQIVTWYTG